jgi:putative NIF3 family GTP cyclohydrolase 1 type 2
MNDWLADMLDGHGVSTVRSIVKPMSTPIPPGFGGAGMGRLVEFGHPVNIGRIVEAYAHGLGGLRHVMVAYPKQPQDQEQRPPVAVRSVAICAGSGHEVLKDCNADLYVTGEMTHHAALRLTMLGKSVLTVFHSNSERRFLRKVLQPRLLKLLQEGGNPAEVLVSEEDADPFEIWDVAKMPEWAYDKVEE